MNAPMTRLAVIAGLLLGSFVACNKPAGSAAPDPSGGAADATAGPGAGEGGAAPAPCKKTGCSGTVCADEDVVTTCEYRPEYACYADAVCERQADGSCGFTPSEALQACLQQPPAS